MKNQLEYSLNFIVRLLYNNYINSQLKYVFEYQKNFNYWKELDKCLSKAGEIQAFFFRYGGAYAIVFVCIVTL